MSRGVLILLWDSSLRAVLVSALVAVILLAARARAGAVCHAAWTAVLGAMLLMPILTSLVPPIAVTVPVPTGGFRVPADTEMTSTPLPLDGAFRGSPAAGSLPRSAPHPRHVPHVGWESVAVIGYLSVLALFPGRLVASSRRVSRLEQRACALEIAGEANIVLGINALRRGDVKNSVRYMREAAQGPTLSDDGQYASSLEPRLVNYLLKAGERESVADFLERAARINAPGKDQMLKDAAAIRAADAQGI